MPAKTFAWLVLIGISVAAAIAPPTRAQDAIPLGVILAARLDSTLSAKSMPGQKISARVMQDVPLDDRQKIRAGSTVSGHVISVGPADSGAGTSIVFVLDQLTSSGKKFSIATELRAIASARAVDGAQIPVSGSGSTAGAAAYTTSQIGGELVYRGGGHVTDRGRVVGEPAPGGVLGRLRANALRGCYGPGEGRGRPQALWLFSTDACGTYDLEGLRIVRGLSGAAAGQIELSSTGKSTVSSGSALLLRVIDAGEPGT